MNTALASVSLDHAISDDAMWRLIADGDLAKLSDVQKSQYYLHLCGSTGLNPATQPFRYMVLNQKLTLYAQKGATDQLRKLHGVDIIRLDKGVEDDLYVVTVAVRDKTGRVDEDMGATPIDGLKGEAKVNAMLKAVTKAKRRATLSICGLGFLDETEVDSIPSAERVSGPMAEHPEPRAIRPAPKRAAQADVVAKVAAGTPQDIVDIETVDAETGEIVPVLPTFEPPTDKQKKMLWALTKRVWQADDDARAGLLSFADHLFQGVVELRSLSKAQVSALIDRLNIQSEADLIALRNEVAGLMDAQEGAVETDTFNDTPE